MSGNIFYEIGRSMNLWGTGKRGWHQNGGYRIGTKGPVWIDTSKPSEVYLTTPLLQLVINRKGSMFSNMEIKEIDENTGKDVTSPELKAFLERINPLQSINQFLREYSIQLDIYGNQFMYRNLVSTLQKFPKCIYNIPAEYMQLILTGKIWDQTTIDGIISGYKYQDSISERIFDPKDILYSKHPDPRNPIQGLSPIPVLKYPISNILAGYKFENVIYEENGGIGMITGGNNKDALGAKPLTPEEKREIEAQFAKNYGTNEGQTKIHVIPGNAEYNSMTFPIKEMQLIEGRDSHFMAIVDNYKLNVNIFSTKNSTYENLKNGILLSYQDSIQPAADEFMQQFDGFIGKKKGVKRIASYDHLPIVKAARSAEKQSLGQIVATLKSAVDSLFITQQDANAIIANELKILKD